MLWYKKVSTNQRTVSGLIWTNESSPLCLRPTFDDEGCPGQGSDLEAGREGSWLGGGARPGGGEDLEGSQQEEEEEHLQGRHLYYDN